MGVSHIQCIHCGRRYSSHKVIYRCLACGGLLEVRYNLSILDFKPRGQIGVWRYADLLPVSGEPVTLFEGGTPLYPCRNLGLGNVHLKHEGLNPTGSFKDRGMTVGVTKAVELGASIVGCSSTGNTAASLSAYAAKAGLNALVLLPQGQVAQGKIAQTLFHGSEVACINGGFDEALNLITLLCRRHNVFLLNSVNPFRLEGQKTLAFELYEQMGEKVPDWVILPVGNGGNISAIYKGFVEYRDLGISDTVPKMIGVQAEKAAPITTAFNAGAAAIRQVSDPQTHATAIQIGNPVNAPKVLRAVKASGGRMTSVPDEQIMAAQRELARKEGIGVEPASAAGIAGLKCLIDEGVVDRSDTVVCVATGSFLKDVEGVLSSIELPVVVDVDLEKVSKQLKLG